jgi:hypothetical protein
MDLADGHGNLLRLIVVGINSFHSKDKYTVTANNGVPHLVFQFQNIPVSRRMNMSDSNGGGYAASEMRKYLIPVDGDTDANSGAFLTGLLDAGVPKAVMWAPWQRQHGVVAGKSYWY